MSTNRNRPQPSFGSRPGPGAALCALLALSLALPPRTAFADAADVRSTSITTNAISAAAPDVDSICRNLDEAMSGDFREKNGQPLKIMSEACAAMTPKDRMAKMAREGEDACRVPIRSVIEGMQKGAGGSEQALDSLCGSSRVQSSERAKTYCALRTTNKNAQSRLYCEAYRSADRAQTGVRVTLGLDVAAAGICWTEYFALLVKPDATVKAKGPCSIAAVGAGLMELTQVARMVGAHFEAGSKSIDGDGNVKNKDPGNALRIAEIVGGSALSSTAITLGVCQWAQGEGKNFGLCGPARAAAAGVTKALGKSYNEVLTESQVAGREAFAEAHGGTGFEAAKKNPKAPATTKDSRLQVAFASATIFTTLAAMRAGSLLTACGTKDSAKTMLQSIFANDAAVAGGAGPNFGSSGLNLSATASFASTAGGSVGSRTNAITAGSPEAFLMPRGSPLAQAAEAIASRHTPAQVAAAAASGASGVAGMIGSAAAAAGGRGDFSKIAGIVGSAFANLPKEEGGYGGSGGARPLASSKSDGGGDLNLKSLFGPGEEKSGEPNRSDEIAYRNLASEDDIWHSKNPRGNNLFQIVSEKYDSVQRKNSLGF